MTDTTTQSASSPGLESTFDEETGAIHVRRVPRLLPLIEELYIVTKDARLVRFGTVLKPSQRDFIARCQRQLDTTGNIRAVVLKARQIGMSTVIEAMLFVLTVLYSNMNAIVVSHEKDSASGILNMTRNYWNTFVFRRFFEERYNGRTHLAWSNNSDIHIATARNVAAGRSQTIQLLHASEVAFWNDPDTLMDGLRQTIPQSGLTVEILESTANGIGNFFHDACTKAMKGQGDYEFCFYPWWSDPECTIAGFAADKREQYLDDSELTQEERDEEAALIRMFDLTPERLAWRRWCIENRCDGDVDTFHQEYPASPHEAFQSTGLNVFELPKLLNHYEPDRGVTGSLMRTETGLEFFEDRNGPLTIFAWPSNDRDWGVYLIGADPTHTNAGDFACAQVLNRRTLEQVAVFRRKTSPIPFAEDLIRLGQFYNRALIAPESTGPGFATIGALVASNYPFVYQRQRIDRMQGITTTDIAGWVTNRETKELAIAHLKRLFDESIVDVGGSLHGLLLHDQATLMELRDYVKLDKGLGYGNSDGSEYDDGVMALAIAVAVHAIEAAPPAYVAPDPTAPMVATPRSGTGVAVMSGHRRLEAPSDPRATSASPSALPEWEAWGRADDGDLWDAERARELLDDLPDDWDDPGFTT